MNATGTVHRRIRRGRRHAGPTLTQVWMETAKDLDGYPRRFGRRVDIGCFELQDGSGLVIIVQ